VPSLESLKLQLLKFFFRHIRKPLSKSVLEEPPRELRKLKSFLQALLRRHSAQHFQITLTIKCWLRIVHGQLVFTAFVLVAVKAAARSSFAASALGWNSR